MTLSINFKTRQRPFGEVEHKSGSLFTKHIYFKILLDGRKTN